jgi:hypothetical protein
MPSGLNRILPRVRISADALRVSALVAAGVTSGYLWRAVFEQERAANVRVVPSQIISVEPFVRESAPAATPHASKRVRRPGAKATSRPRRATLVHRAARRSPAPRSNPAGSPRPAPGRPQPQQPAGPELRLLVSPPPSAGPAVAPPAPAAPAPAVTTVSPTSPASSPPAAKGEPTSTNGADERSRPGWGHGDKNHTHTGPKKNP